MTEPNQVKHAFFDFYSTKFQKFEGTRPCHRSNGFRHLDQDSVRELEVEFSEDEVKSAVWSCGSDRAPGPDGFTFKFLKRC